MKTILRMTLVLSLFTGSARAFSLLGPYDTWMQSNNGFQLPGDIGGPVNLGEEYRWNVPVLTYAFDESFLDYFGSNGVWAVEQAIQVLNDLPPASLLDPASYPTETAHWNYKAQALNLTDLKSKTLVALLEQLGLAQPTRHTFAVHDFTFVNGNPVAQTVTRNFDPFTFAPTNRVNATEYGFTLSASTNGSLVSVTAEKFLLDPLNTDFSTAVADDAVVAGGFYTGLTRDDVGGLRYLLRTNNLNLETLLPGVRGVGPDAGTYVNQALRRGVDKITFVRRELDFFLGQFFQPYTNQFTDYYVSNNVLVAQQLERVVTVPDILFTAANGESEIRLDSQITRTGTTNWWNSTLGNASGPGLIRPRIRLEYSKPGLTEVTWDTQPGQHGGRPINWWGTFDGSTNDPIAYPQGIASSGLTLNLRLLRNEQEIGRSTWQIPLPAGETVIVQTSTNLVNWSFHTLFGAGHQVEWTHHCSDAQRFFRLVPNN